MMSRTCLMLILLAVSLVDGCYVAEHQQMNGIDVDWVYYSGETTNQKDASCCSQCWDNPECEFWVRDDIGNCWLRRSFRRHYTSDTYRGSFKVNCANIDYRQETYGYQCNQYVGYIANFCNTHKDKTYSQCYAVDSCSECEFAVIQPFDCTSISFLSDYGTCDSYAVGQPNHSFCLTDSNNNSKSHLCYAMDSCAECQTASDLCTCANGNVVTERPDCTESWSRGAPNTRPTELCASCNVGYSGYQCDVLNVCTCAKGTKVADGPDCITNGAELCASCDDGYHGPQCEINVCTCENGTKVADGPDCAIHGTEMCTSCNDGYGGPQCQALECVDSKTDVWSIYVSKKTPISMNPTKKYKDFYTKSNVKKLRDNYLQNNEMYTMVATVSSTCSVDTSMSMSGGMWKINIPANADFLTVTVTDTFLSYKSSEIRYEIKDTNCSGKIITIEDMKFYKGECSYADGECVGSSPTDDVWSTYVSKNTPISMNPTKKYKKFYTKSDVKKLRNNYLEDYEVYTMVATVSSTCDVDTSMSMSGKMWYINIPANADFLTVAVTDTFDSSKSTEIRYAIRNTNCSGSTITIEDMKFYKGECSYGGSGRRELSTSCDASMIPNNGDVGTCTSHLPKGESCSIECNNGYVVSGMTICGDNGVLTSTGNCVKSRRSKI